MAVAFTFPFEHPLINLAFEYPVPHILSIDFLQYYQICRKQQNVLGDFCRKRQNVWASLYQHEKVDTKKILQLNNFSKVDNRDIFVRFDFPKVDIFNRFTPFSFSKVYIFPKSLSDSTVARLFCTNLGSAVNSLFSNVPLHFISPLLYRFL